MLATDIPLREHSHLDIPAASPPLEDRLCPGCKTSVVNEQGGLVVAFGQSFFHVDCFKCAKCRNQVTADTNLLLLSDGSPICANCSYSCNICHLPILDEAIMTGDDSYHAHCFKCKVCNNRIDELVFAKTSQGIYCMNCHNERMIKIRKHAQKKAEREKANGGSASSRSREYESRNFQERSNSEEHSRPGLVNVPLSVSAARSESSSRVPEHPRSPARPVHGSHMHDASTATPPSYSQSMMTKPHDNTLQPFSSQPSSSQSPSSSVAPLSDSIGEVKQIASTEQRAESIDQVQGPSKSNTLPIMPASSADFKRRSSYGNAAHPLNLNPRQDSLMPQTASNLAHPTSTTSRNDKRRSINPALSLSPFRDMSLAPPTAMPARQASPLTQEHTSLDDESADNTIVMSPPTMLVELDATVASSSRSSLEVRDYHNPDRAEHSSVTLSPGGPRRVSSASTRSAETNHSGRSSSRADVPRSVESGTDTEPENDIDSPTSGDQDALPPVPPPKDSDNPRNLKPTYGDIELDASEAVNTNEMSEDLGESLAVERTSHTTFIAPALPPIRFSMNPGDFSELLNSVGGLPSLRSLDNLAKLTRESQGVPSTPPPTASSIRPPSDTQVAEEFLDPSETNYSKHNTISHAVSMSSRSLQELNSEDSDILESQPPDSGNPSSPVNAPRSSAPTLRRTLSDSDTVIVKLRETLSNAKVQGTRYLKVDLSFVEAIVDALESREADYAQLKNRVDGMNRESKRYIDGLTVAQAEYDRELRARRDAEAEVTRLRVLLSGQAVRITALSGDSRRQELRQQLSKELNDNLSGLEHDLSRLKVERDVALAEVEELSVKRSTSNASDVVPTNLGRSLTKRLESIRNQYQRELEPLTRQKEVLTREIAELKAVRDVFLEETAVLNARNEELAQLSAVYARRIDSVPETPAKPPPDVQQSGLDVSRSQIPNNLVPPSMSASTSASSTTYDESQELKTIKSHRSENELHTPAKPKFKWPGSKSKDLTSPAPAAEGGRSKTRIDHNFQQLSILRFTRCDHCGDKMWGSQLRCTVCSTSIHVRCAVNLQTSCTQPQHQNGIREEHLPLHFPGVEPSMFGRDLTEQVQADSQDEDRRVPVIVEKCIEAVEARALDYEGIYRKTGGSGQSKAITQMFERGDYASFDLCDSDRFNDICSVTSVLKTYFRSLPNPLLTFDLHDQFTAACGIRDSAVKHQTLNDLVHKLPEEHFFTLRMLMLHLHRIHKRSEKNLMNARNLGVVFGPTLMRSRDPGAEFSDMAGKALFIEWLVENAPRVFDSTES
ncbi:hypothetical protein CVT26_013686 [Gymnopilus dilepis]|uniref:RhoGAP-domain-containing protein n=1 Tax=Gymnopilus dilepis TaxID=231916 RepID=A0A409YWK4_9AGAR|nr:hypothetical protein CVT26_013686 [Gymnopilus dilepis]